LRLQNGHHHFLPPDDKPGETLELVVPVEFS
jgi:hypothetical protein